ncbi:uncharacterized protein LOC133850054 isoform X2 [Drosophila sulfurigaster albostrigata]|uniref:uncharacterized protein LOC133850054 isoform X2 n=1 Tax=Drosophila sulfurigaster albostrigata TaxID=89887 RepID=UPI002D21C83E|nr:uncharacterized protein LOC133850054 isoform X2 [Drosophila sulfurigaster albostrigata]XP_062141998.1 uncharacterized protein LOC133850054 isoform X2 [Drosophila sulfurigaster albostrigata]XP_062141999.1 uncharacterized protein LOC133850054 isoform X2 [Drosophila sulfurigaster albostrigata]
MRFLHILCQTAFLLILVELSSALRDVRVRVPHAVKRGEKAILKCFYDIEDDSLYSVKWYKGRREFYRYTPKETPPMKVFHFPGVKVRRQASNESQVVLDAVTMPTSGKYSCEVSADAPSFHTLIAAAELEVIETPHNAPFITGIRPRYRVGDILRGNCTSRHSRPAANLTWNVNNEEVNPSHVRHHKILRDTRNEMETAIVGIHFVVTDQHFENGKLKLRCNAQLHDVYWKTTEKTILEADLSGKYGGGANGNRVSADEVYDQYTLHEDEQFHSKKNSYLTQLQDFLFHFVPSGEEDDGVDGLEDGGAAWRGVGSGSSSISVSSIQSVAFSGATATATLLAVLSWSLARQLVSHLVAITKPGQLPMRDEALQKEQQHCQRQSLRVSSCSSDSDSGSFSNCNCNSDSSKGCSRCIRQLT